MEEHWTDLREVARRDDIWQIIHIGIADGINDAEDSLTEIESSQLEFNGAVKPVELIANGWSKLWTGRYIAMWWNSWLQKERLANANWRFFIAVKTKHLAFRSGHLWESKAAYNSYQMPTLAAYLGLGYK